MTRASIFEKVQLGVESVEGTAVAADTKLQNSVFTALTPNITTQDVMAAGGKAPVDVIVNKEWTTGTVTGTAGTTDMLYWLSSLIEKPTYATNVHTMSVNQSEAQYSNFFTLEFGGASGASKVPGCYVRSFSLELDGENAPTYTAEIMGRKLSDGITMTADPDELPIYGYGAKSVNIYLASNEAGLSNSANIIKPLAATFTVQDVRQPFYTVSADESYTGSVEVAHLITFKIEVEQTSSLDYMTQLRNRTLKYVRIELLGDTVSAVAQKTVIDFPAKFQEPSRGDNQGVRIGGYILKAMHDGSAGMNTPLRVKVTENCLTTDQREAIDVPSEE